MLDWDRRGGEARSHPKKPLTNGAGEIAQWVRVLCSTNMNQECSCTLVTLVLGTRVSWRQRMAGACWPISLAKKAASSRFSEEPCLKGLRQSDREDIPTGLPDFQISVLYVTSLIV